MKLVTVNYESIKLNNGTVSLDYSNFISLVQKAGDILLLVTKDSHEKLLIDKHRFRLGYDYAYSTLDGIVFNEEGTVVDFAEGVNSAEQVVLKQKQIPYDMVERIPEDREFQHYKFKSKKINK